MQAKKQRELVAEIDCAENHQRPGPATPCGQAESAQKQGQAVAPASQPFERGKHGTLAIRTQVARADRPRHLRDEQGFGIEQAEILRAKLLAEHLEQAALGDQRFHLLGIDRIALLRSRSAVDKSSQCRQARFIDVVTAAAVENADMKVVHGAVGNQRTPGFGHAFP